jgi:hypothetical protein
MLTKLKVEDVTSFDEDGETRGVKFACGDQRFVTLIFDKTTSLQQTDDLSRLLEKMKLAEVMVITP